MSDSEGRKISKDKESWAGEIKQLLEFTKQEGIFTYRRIYWILLR